MCPHYAYLHSSRCLRNATKRNRLNAKLQTILSLFLVVYGVNDAKIMKLSPTPPSPRVVPSIPLTMGPSASFIYIFNKVLYVRVITIIATHASDKVRTGEEETSEREKERGRARAKQLPRRQGAGPGRRALRPTLALRTARALTLALKTAAGAADDEDAAEERRRVRWNRDGNAAMPVGGRTGGRVGPFGRQGARLRLAPAV